MRILLASLSLVLLASTMTAASALSDKGPLVSMELRQVEIRDMLRAVGQEHGLNLIVDDSVTGTVTVSLRDVPLWDAIESILSIKGYKCRRLESGLVIIEKMSESERLEGGLELRQFRVRHMKAETAKTSVQGMLGEGGKVIVVEQSNSIIVKDRPEAIDRVEAMLEEMDSRPEQIMIEARIVEVSKSSGRDLGIQWGGGMSLDGVTSALFGINFPASDWNSGTGNNAVGTLGLGYMKSGVQLSLVLSALEDAGDAKILSNPRIMVQENSQAKITSGTEILIPAVTTTATAGGVATTTRPETLTANLEMTVTPRSLGDGQVYLVIDTKREEFDFAKEVEGYPPKYSRTANTSVIVGNGETIVIGGIFKKNESRSEKGLPFVSRIPVLGWLFKKQSRSEDQVELLIFITPKLVPEGHSG